VMAACWAGLAVVVKGVEFVMVGANRL